MKQERKKINNLTFLTHAGKMTNLLFTYISLKIAESAKRSFASKVKIWFFDAKLRFALNPCGESDQLIVQLNLA